MKTPHENKMVMSAQTKSGALTESETRWLKEFVKRKSGDWPRKSTDADAINLQPPTSELVAKSKRHVELENQLAEAQKELHKVMQLIRDQEQEYLKNTALSGPGSASYHLATVDK